MSRQSTNHQQIPSSDHTGNHRVVVDRNSNLSPDVNGTPRMETERLLTSCFDEGLNRKRQQSLCRVSIGTEQIAELRVVVCDAEYWCRPSGSLQWESCHNRVVLRNWDIRRGRWSLWQCRRDPENRPSRKHRRVRLTAQPGPSHMQAKKKGISDPGNGSHRTAVFGSSKPGARQSSAGGGNRASSVGGDVFPRRG